MTRRPFQGEDRYRTICEPRIVDMLIVHGWRFDVVEGRRDAALAGARAALQTLVDDGLAFALAPDGSRLFDPVEVWNRVIWAGVHDSRSVWEDHCLPHARRECWEGRTGGGDLTCPPTLGEGPGRSFEVTIRRTFNLAGAGFHPGDRVRLRLPAPLPETTIDDLALEALAPAGARAAFGPARLDVVLPTPACGEATAGVTASFTAAPNLPQAAAPLDREYAELYLRPVEGLIRASPRVDALAQRLTAGAATPLAVLRRLWNFMLDELCCGAIHYDGLFAAQPLDWVLDHGWYDCKAGSALLATLCRSCAIPARVLTGYLLHTSAPAFHTWVEAWIDDIGWLPLDLQTWELSAGGRDAPWRDHYFGQLDERLIVERLPRLFGGTGDVRLSGPWQMVTALTEGGKRIAFEHLDTGAWIYREDIDVRRLLLAGPAAAADPPGSVRSRIGAATQHAGT